MFQVGLVALPSLPGSFEIKNEAAAQFEYNRVGISIRHQLRTDISL